MKPPIGIYLINFSASSIIWLIYIITTNKNKIVIAPTYTIKNNIAINSTSNKINKAVAPIKTNTKKRIEWIGFLLKITKNPETNINKTIIENIKFNIFRFYFSKKEFSYNFLLYFLCKNGYLFFHKS